MFKIIEKKQLNEVTFSMTILAPLVSKNIKPGQFVMVMTDENSERIPLTIADFDKDNGTVTIVYQAIGASTIKLSKKNEGEEIAHFAGPLGAATELEGIKNACVIGGGVGGVLQCNRNSHIGIGQFDFAIGCHRLGIVQIQFGNQRCAVCAQVDDFSVDLDSSVKFVCKKDLRHGLHGHPVGGEFFFVLHIDVNST